MYTVHQKLIIIMCYLTAFVAGPIDPAAGQCGPLITFLDTFAFALKLYKVIKENVNGRRYRR